MRIRVGTRKSALALRQAETVRERLVALGGLDPEDVVLVPFSSRGDDLTGPIASLGTKGAFTESLERALAENEIDVAVHSLKDLPVEPRPGLAVAAVLEREDPSDVHVSRDGVSLASLPRGASVGTGSPRRRAHLRALRGDLVPVELRGNVDTRLARARRGDPASVILAAAGLLRLGLFDAAVMERLPLDSWLPAPGQGAIAVQARTGDSAVAAAAASIDHAPTRRAVEAERAALAGLGGGCLLPFGAFARDAGGGRLVLRVALYGAESGDLRVRAEVSGEEREATALGRLAAERLKALAPWAARA